MSDRYVLAAGLVIALFLAAIFYGRSQPRRDECPSNEVLLDAAAIDPKTEILTQGERVTKISAGRLLGRLPAPDPGGPTMYLAINRTFGLRHQVLEPAIVLPGRPEPDEVEISMHATPEGPIPVHYAYERRGPVVRLTAYFMAHRLEALRSPLWTRIRSGPAALVGGSWPITLFVISSVGRPSQLEANRKVMDSWLLGAWAHYHRVCGS